MVIPYQMANFVGLGDVSTPFFRIVLCGKDNVKETDNICIGTNCVGSFCEFPLVIFHIHLVLYGHIFLFQRWPPAKILCCERINSYPVAKNIRKHVYRVEHQL